MALRTSTRHHNLSALIARRATTEARKARRRGTRAVTQVVLAHQMAQATTSIAAVPDMLAEQDITATALALLNSPAFTTSVEDMTRMIEATADAMAFDRLVESLVQDAGRAAESVSIAVRPNIYHVRQVNPPCCSRCAVLAGRVYKWSTGFKRHPGCDCTMIPTTVASRLRQDPAQLVRDGMVRNLSKADTQALGDGADLDRLVNVRNTKGNLFESGSALRRGSRPTPAAIYLAAGDDRAKAIALLEANGYIRT